MTERPGSTHSRWTLDHTLTRNKGQGHVLLQKQLANPPVLSHLNLTRLSLSLQFTPQGLGRCRVVHLGCVRTPKATQKDAFQLLMDAPFPCEFTVACVSPVPGMRVARGTEKTRKADRCVVASRGGTHPWQPLGFSHLSSAFPTTVYLFLDT